MKAPHPFRGRKPRLTAGDAPRLELHGPSRSEHDLLGEREVPATALYGIQTLRAMENFAISGVELREFPGRSEEHTSELQSRLHLVCRLLLEKKKKNKI